MKVQPIKRELTEPSAVRAPRKAPRWLMPLVRALLVLGDVAVTTGAFVLAFSLREGWPLFRTGNSFEWSPHFAPYGAILPFVIIIRLLALTYYNLYKLRGEFSLVDDGLRIFKATAVGSLLIVA